MNGDVLVSGNFRALLKFHVLERADVTVSTTRYESVIPYGVVDMAERCVVRVDEKPSFLFTVNAGVYVVRGETFETIKRGERVDFTDFLNSLLRDASR